MKHLIRPLWTTIVNPSEYDILTQFNNAVKDANKHKAYCVEFDLGKVVGLFNDWVDRGERIKELEAKLKLLGDPA